MRVLLQSEVGICSAALVANECGCGTKAPTSASSLTPLKCAVGGIMDIGLEALGRYGRGGTMRTRPGGFGIPSSSVQDSGLGVEATRRVSWAD